MIIESTVDYKPTPEELADEFCELYQDGQAKFFNRVANMFKSPYYSLEMQLEYVSQSKILTDDARRLMSLIGDYAEHNR